MDSYKRFPSFFLFQAFLSLLSPMTAAQNSNLFAEYIGAEFADVKFSDVPINPNVAFHFILAFAIDYTSSSPPTPTNGQFNIFWDTGNLSPSAVSAIKQSHSNVKVAFSLGGATVNDDTQVHFSPSSIDSWVGNAVSSLTSIIQEYNLDGIDIDYEMFNADPDTFAECIGQLITTLKNNGVISFASIAPYVDQQSYYQALWGKYSAVIDYVNYQFYGYYANTTVSEFLGYFNTQTTVYNGGKVLASFTTDPTGGFGGLLPENGFFDACKTLQNEGKLTGIFVWSADNSKSNGFQYEKQAEALLANALSSQ